MYNIKNQKIMETEEDLKEQISILEKKNKTLRGEVTVLFIYVLLSVLIQLYNAFM